MPYPFLLSYARRDAKIGESSQSDPNFETFVARLNQRVSNLTGKPGFVDRNNILPGQDWHNELAQALRTAQTMVCLYSPSYFLSEHCGKEMQVFLDRRRNYIRANGGKKPANIIPVMWHPAPRRIPETLPKIQYPTVGVESENEGAWNLGDQGRDEELKHFTDLIALRVRDAADETPLAPLRECPRLGAVFNAFLPPPLPLTEFESGDATGGPDTVTFVYESSHWSAWPWAPPDEQAVLHLAAAVAKGHEMESTQLTFDVADANLTDRLASIRRTNNVAILLVNAASLGHEGLRARIKDFDLPHYSSFATIVIGNHGVLDLQDKLEQTFSKRATRHLYLVETRESFSKVIAEALDRLKLAIVNDPQAPNLIGTPSEYQKLPAVNGPGVREAGIARYAMG